LKRETETYQKISNILNIAPTKILFLSDIIEELTAADKIGFQTIQLVRPGTVLNWKRAVRDFIEIELHDVV
jgi:enolase-phosphatase E1